MWINGCTCWIALSFLCKPIANRITIPLNSAFCYAFFLCLIKSFPDENSINAFITMVSCIGIIGYLRTVVTARYADFMLLAICLSIIIQIVIAFGQYHNTGLIHGQLANSGAFANYLSALIPFLLTIVVSKQQSNRLLKIVTGIILAAATMLLLFTQARAAFLGVLVAFIYVLFATVKKNISNFRMLIVIVSTIMVPLLLFALYFLKPASAAGRITIYQVSAKIIHDHPFTGIGPNRFAAEYNNYQSDYFSTGEQPVSKQMLAADVLEAYNWVFQVLTEYGLIGLLLFIWILYEIIRKWCYNNKHHHTTWQQTGSIACILSLFVAGLFSNPFHLTPVLLLLVYHLSVITAPQRTKVLQPAKNKYGLFLALLISATVVVYIILEYRATKQWEKAATAGKLNDFEHARHFYDKAFPVLKYNGDFLFNYGAEACVAGDYRNAIFLLERAKLFNSLGAVRIFLGDAYTAAQQYQLAESNYLAAIYTVPSHIYPKYKLIQLYKKWGKTTLASEWTKRTLQFPVKISSEFSERLLQQLKEGK